MKKAITNMPTRAKNIAMLRVTSDCRNLTTELSAKGLSSKISTFRGLPLIIPPYCQNISTTPILLNKGKVHVFRSIELK